MSPERLAAMAVTEQYLIGELSWRLGQLADAMPDVTTAREVARLRRRCESCTLAELVVVLRNALGVADTACWESLAAGDAIAFVHQSTASADLYGFGVCAGLIDDS